MIFFCIQVMELIVSAKKVNMIWANMDKVIREKIQGGKLSEETRAELQISGTGLRRYSTYYRFKSGRSTREKPELNQILFEALRKEFINERSTEYPFEPAPKEHQVDQDFNFGSYLIRCHSHILEEIIDIKPPALFFIGGCVALYYAFAILVGGSMAILAWTWVFLGFFMFGFHIYFEWYLVNLRDQFIPRKYLKLWDEEGEEDVSQEEDIDGDQGPIELGESIAHFANFLSGQYECDAEPAPRPLFKRQSSLIKWTFSKAHMPDLLSSDGDEGDSNEETSLLSQYGDCEGSYSLISSDASDGSDERLPGWCDVDLQTTQPSWFVRMIIGGRPDRQQVLFWFSQKGPILFINILQVQLLFTGIYLGLVFLHFLPFVLRTYSWFFAIVYLILALGPLWAIHNNKKPLISVLTQVNSIGNMRKPHVVSDVLLEEKSLEVIRVFIILYKIRKFAEKQCSAPSLIQRNDADRRVSFETKCPFARLEIHQVGKAFDAIDTDGSGEIDRDEMSQLLLRMGACVSEDSLDRMFQLLDADGNGSIERNEFISWYVNNAEEDDKISPKQRARELFETFDLNKSGEITIGQFKRKLDSLNFGFGIDEIGAIANELDRDRSGAISLTELERLVEKHHPNRK